MFKNVTIDEVTKAAGESTIAAVECCMKHWLYNANIQNLLDTDLSVESCALCKRYLAIPGDGCRDICPLRDNAYTCCKEYDMASRSKYLDGDLDGFKRAAACLYIRLATIREKLITGLLIREIPQEPKIIHKIGNKYRHLNEWNVNGVNCDYLLVQCEGSKVVLVCLKSCNRYRNPIVVKNINNITQEEFNKIASQEFELIP